MAGIPAKLGWIGFFFIWALTACDKTTSPGSDPLVGKWNITEATVTSVSRTTPPSEDFPDDSSSTTEDETGKGFYLQFKANDTVLIAIPNLTSAGKRAAQSAATVAEISGKWSVSGNKLTLITKGAEEMVADTNVYVMTQAGTNLDLVQTISTVETVEGTTYTNIFVRSFRASKAE